MVRSSLDFGVRQVDEGIPSQITDCGTSSLSLDEVPTGDKWSVPFEGEMLISIWTIDEVPSENGTHPHEVSLTISTVLSGGELVEEIKKFEWEGPVTGLHTLALNQGSLLTIEGVQNLQICVAAV